VSSTVSSPYSRLAPFVREYIYEKRWQALKDVQEAAIGAVLDSGAHVLIAAGTAAGKTEACFFPILTFLAGTGNQSAPRALGRSIRVLYIGPLKALINDQFERLAPLLARADIRVSRWHGDVDESHKRQVLDDPPEVLQITPESLEALFLRHSGKIAVLFRNLDFVIIDEVHAFIGTDRGSQLICQLERIRRQAACDPRRIGLSATLGDYAEAAAWLGSGTAREVTIAGEEKTGAPGQGRRVSLAVDYCGDAGFYQTLYNRCRGDETAPSGKCVIFTNSRIEAEETAAALKDIAKKRGETDHYRVHHGSLAASLRRETETGLREAAGSGTVAATATLEMGIDIGRLDKVIQIGAPSGVSAFVQRLGRSGRRGSASRMYFISREFPADYSSLSGAAAAMAKMPWALLKTIAVIQLYLEERWIENPDPKPLPYSLLCHETLSVLASLGEQSAGALKAAVLSLPPFAKIPPEDYSELLAGLLSGDIIETTEEGKLLPGLEGENLVNHYSFYSVFPGDEEFRVTSNGREIGKINFAPPEGGGIFLGGRTWKVLSVSYRKGEITVSPGTDAGAKIWRGGPGSTHTRVVRRMRRVLEEPAAYPYLTPAAAQRLDEARRLSAENGFTETAFIPAGVSGKGEPRYFFLPWLGTRGMRTLTVLLRKKENRERLGITFLEEENPYALKFAAALETEQFKTELKILIQNLYSLEGLADPRRIPLADKYDYLLPQRLLEKQYAANMLDKAELLSLF
jgi:ATP-dependent Lhr-like helicase